MYKSLKDGREVHVGELGNFIEAQMPEGKWRQMRPESR